MSKGGEEMSLSQKEMQQIAEREAHSNGFLPICSWAGIRNDCLVVTLMTPDKKSSRNVEIFPEDDEQAIVNRIASKAGAVK